MLQKTNAVERDFFIKTALDQGAVVRVQGSRFACPGAFCAVGRDSIDVELQTRGTDAQPCVFERVSAYFECAGTTYAFDSVIRKVNGFIITIDKPPALSKSPRRKYVRVKAPPDIRVSFSVENEEIKLDYPVCQEYGDVSDVNCSSEFDVSDLSSLIGSFREKLSAQATVNTVIMFRTRGPQCLEEEMIAKTGKILYIPSTSSSLPKIDPYPEGAIITESIEETFEPPDYFINGSEFEKRLQEKKAQGINSEIWQPIVYYQYVVGYVYLANQGEPSASFDVSVLDYAREFSRVLARFLKNSGYFGATKSRTPRINHNGEIIDMSPDGMLLALDENETHIPLKVGTIFSLQITLKNKTLQCAGKVMRRYKQGSATCYGVSFTDLTHDKMLALHEYLYRRPYAESDVFARESMDQPSGSSAR